MDHKTRKFDMIEQQTEPHAHPEIEVHDDDGQTDRLTRRLRIQDSHLREHGYTPGCPRCALHRQGLHARAKHSRHNEDCKSRIYKAIKASGKHQAKDDDHRLRTREPKTPRDEPQQPTDGLPPDADMDDEPRYLSQKSRY